MSFSPASRSRYFALERARESPLRCLRRPASLAPANEVRPERDLGARDVAPEDIRALVPVVERLIIRALKARAAQAHDLHVVPETVLTIVGETCAV